MKVARRYRFTAYHSLPGVEGYDQPHDHRYTVEVVVEGTVDPQTDMILDTVVIDDAMVQLCATLEGADLNEATGLFTTVENLAEWFYEKVSRFANQVTVWEDDDRWGQAP